MNGGTVAVRPSGAAGPGDTLRHALLDSRERWRDLVAMAADLAFETDAWGRFVFVMPDPALGLYLNLTVEDESLPASAQVLGVSRIVTGAPVAIGPLRFLFSRIRVAQGNLAGPGRLGSEVIGQVAVANG